MILFWAPNYDYTNNSIICKFNTWCSLNNLFLNIKKCKVMTFSKIRNPMSYNYYLNNILLDRVSLYKDLGIYSDSSLTFNDHYIHI